MDIRERVIAACENSSTKVVAERFGVSPAWVRRLKQHQRQRGDIVPRTGGGSRGRKFDRDLLAARVAEKPDSTLAELRDHLGIQVSLWAICKALQELGLSYKKKVSTPPSRIGRTSGKAGKNGG
jgi:transposase